MLCLSYLNLYVVLKISVSWQAGRCPCAAVRAVNKVWRIIGYVECSSWAESS